LRSRWQSRAASSDPGTAAGRPRPTTIPYGRAVSPPCKSPISSGRRASRSTARITIPFAFGKNEETGRVGNFQRAAAVLQGHPPADLKPPGYPFDDTDIYKVLEGASYTLSVKPDPKLSGYLDGLIETIAAAQEKDGYLYTTRTIDPLHPHPWAGPRAGSTRRDLSHELYNLGHLYEAAVAHYQATGSARCSTSRSHRRSARRAPSGPASRRSGRATRSPRWASRSSIA
jgi:hypothetical protein